MPNLQDLLHNAEGRVRWVSDSLYALLEALVEAQEHYTVHRSFLKFDTFTCGECGFFREHSGCRSVDDRDDDEWASRFYYTDPESPACRNFVQSGDTQTTAHSLCKELAEAKAECRWLITKNDEAKAELKRWRNRWLLAIEERDRAQAQLEAHIQRNTNGGGFTQGAWRTRDIRRQNEGEGLD